MKHSVLVHFVVVVLKVNEMWTFFAHISSQVVSNQVDAIDNSIIFQIGCVYNSVDFFQSVHCFLMLILYGIPQII